MDQVESREARELRLMELCAAGNQVFWLDDDMSPGTQHNIATLKRSYPGNREIYRMSSRYTLEEALTKLRSLGYGYYSFDSYEYFPL